MISPLERQSLVTLRNTYLIYIISLPTVFLGPISSFDFYFSIDILIHFYSLLHNPPYHPCLRLTVFCPVRLSLRLDSKLFSKNRARIEIFEGWYDSIELSPQEDKWNIACRFSQYTRTCHLYSLEFLKEREIFRFLEALNLAWLHKYYVAW